MTNRTKRTAERGQQSLIQPCLFGIMVVLLGTTLTPTAAAEGEITWWNVSKLLREFVSNGLVANKLQEQLDKGYKWQQTEVDGKERLNKISRIVSDIFERNIHVVRTLKRVIEREYDNWPVYTRDQIDNNTLCCEREADNPAPEGCAVLVRPEQENATMRATHPPQSVIREFKKSANIFGQNITQYFAFNDGSLYMYPSQSTKNLPACTTYDPRLRYFFTQCKSPEPRSVVLVVDTGGETKADFLLKVVERILKALSPIDRMALCLPDGDKCRTRRAGALTEPIWPRQDFPLGTLSLLGHTVPSSEKNKKLINRQLKSCLESILGTSANGHNGTSNKRDIFSDHVAALQAGLDLLQNHSSSHSYHLPVGEYHQVLVYVTARTSKYQWYEADQLVNQLNRTIRDSVHVVIHPIKDAATNIEDSVIMEHSNGNNIITVTIASFANEKELYSSPTSIASFGLNDPDQPVIPMPYWDAFGRGYIMSICLPLTKGTQFLGSICTDFSIVNLLENETNVDDIEDAYVFIVNSLGNTLMHPLLPAPHSITQDPSYVTIGSLEQATEVQPLLEDIVGQVPGIKDVRGMQVEPIGRPRGSKVPSPVKLFRRDLRYLWVPINNTDLTIALVLPLQEGKVLSSEYKCLNTSLCQTTDFQYHLPRTNNTRKYCKFFGTKVTEDRGLVKFAPSCYIDVLSYIHDETPAQISKLYSIFKSGTMPYDEILRSDLKGSVRLLEEAEKLWQKQRQDDPDLNKYIGARYMGTADGAFMAYPGTVLRQAYDHRKRPWYLRGVSSTEKASISMTTPYCDELGAGMVHTITKTLHDPFGNPMAVVAGDISLQYIMTNFHVQIAHCKTHTCLLVDRLGYVVLKSDWATFDAVHTSCATNRDIEAAHLNRLAPDIARDMIGDKILKRKGCHDYEQDLTFYYWSLSLAGYRTLHNGPNYVAHKIPQTNLYLIVRTAELVKGNCNCDPYLRGELVKCHDTCALECECPCVAGPDTQPCHDPEADVHKHPVPACKPRGLTSVRANNNTVDPNLDDCKAAAV